MELYQKKQVLHKVGLAVAILVMTIVTENVFGQHKLEFAGQVSTFANYSPDNDLDVLLGCRYIPELDYAITLKNDNILDFEVSANIYGSVSFHPFDSSFFDGNIQAYRLWTRFTGKQYEIRVGLQKIDFGSAMLLRPLQWFDEIDPRDPLKFTIGVYGALGRYYFLNNANIWLWVLYGNENPRGFEIVKTYCKYPEFGGRVQYPVPKGEIAVSYHHRTADSQDLSGVPSYEQIPENRIGLDGKWDVEVGLWFEAAYIHKSKDIGILSNQTYLTIGVDYTFGVGNGLNVVVEHLVSALDKEPFAFKNTTNITASTLSYPIGLFNNISTVFYYNWDTCDFSFFLNYEHQFKNITGYIMPYYNPKNSQSLSENEFVDTFSGPGIRLMLVYNH